MQIRKKVVLLLLSFLLIFSQFAGSLYVSAETNDTTAASEAKVIDIAAGNHFTLAVKDDGSVWSWGQNNVGQLGINSTKDRFLPQKIKDLTDVVAVSAGGMVTQLGDKQVSVGHALSLKKDGTVWSWGFNQQGQLGDGTTAHKGFPVQVTGLTNVTSIASGGAHNLALKEDGTVWSWGDNTSGQLGDGTYDNRTRPVQVKGLQNIVKVFSGVESNSSFAIAEDGKAYAWGSNWGKLGTSSKIGDETEPVEVTEVSNIESIASGADHTLMTTKDGQVFAWGDNYKGRLGNGSAENQETPVLVEGLSGLSLHTLLTNNHSVALTNEGKVWSWGYNAFGTLGNDSKESSAEPIEISSLSNIKKVAIGNSHSVALTDDGEVFTWGMNTYGQLGLEQSGVYTTPQQVDVVETLTVEKLTFDKNEVLLEEGKSHQIKVHVQYDNGTSGDVTAEAIYSAEFPENATVTKEGLVEALKEGTTSIYVTYRGQTEALVVTVHKPVDNKDKAIELAELRIAALPDTIQYKHKEDITEARNAVSTAVDLGAKEEDIPSIQKLKASEATIVEMDAALQETVKSITDLPKVEEVELSDREAVEAVRTKVQELLGLGVASTDIENYSLLVEVEDQLKQLIEETYELLANAGYNQTVVAGQTVKFDGTLSKDSRRISRYEWDFGDGSKGEGATSNHIYKEPGEYSVTLNVFDRKGESASQSIIVTVVPAEEVATLDVRVLDKESRGALPNATVVVQFPDGTNQTVKADSTGLAQLVAEPGDYTVYAYREGFKPASQKVKFDKENPQEYNIELERGEVAVGEVTVDRMTKDEIIAAGIDVNDPDNQWVYKFEVHLSFTQQGESKPIKFYANPKSVINPGPVSFGSNVIYPYVIPTGHADVRPMVAFLMIPGEARWLKEFFNVELIVENQASEEFTLENSKAVLNLPDGLTLAPTPEPQTLEIDLGKIVGSGEGQANWIIRGDKKGLYHLSADFEGTLMPFNETVKANFVTKEPFRVWGDDALKMFVYAQEGIQKGSPYSVIFQIVNVSDIPIYNLALELFLSKGKGYEYQSDTGTSISELSPGKTLEKKVTLIPTICECGGVLDLNGSYVLHTGGNANIETQILPLSAYTDFSNLPTMKKVNAFKHANEEKVGFTWESVDDAIEYNILTINDGIISTEPILKVPADKNMVTLDETVTNTRYLIETVTNEGMLYLHPVIDTVHNLEKTSKANQVLVSEGASILKVDDSATPYELTMPLEGEKRHNFDIRLQKVNEVVMINWPGGHQSYFSENGDQYEPLNKGSKDEKLHKNAEGDYTLTLTNQRQYVFNDKGQLMKQNNGKGQPLTFTYTEQGLLSKIMDPVTDTFMELHYNDAELLTSVQDHRGNKTILTYDDQQLVTSIKDQNDSTLSYEYDEEGRINKIKDSEGVVLQENKYNADGVLSEVVDANGNIQKYTYSESNGELHVTVTDNKGQKYTMVRNEKGEIIRTENNGSVTKLTYDENGNVRTMMDDAGNVLTSEYDAKGNLISLTDPNGNKTSYTYDDRNNLISETDSLGNKTTYEYNADNQLIQLTDAEGHVSNYSYNKAGLQQEVTLPNGGVRKLSYDKGLIKTEVDATGIETKYEYDEQGRLTKVTKGGKDILFYTYDEKGNLKTQKDALGNETSYTYNHRGQVLTETDANGNKTTFNYNTKGELIEQKDAKGHVTSYVYDSLGNLIETIDSIENHTKMTYNSTRQLTSITDPLGHKTTFEYDSLGNHIKTIDPSGNAVEVNAYDKMGNQTSAKDALGQETKFEYNPLNQLTTKTDALNRTVQSEYNKIGELVNTINPLEGKSAQTFDELGNLQSLIDPNQNETQFKYDKEGRITGVTLSSGSTIRMTYNEQGLLEKETNARGQEVVYGYDDAGNVIRKTNPEGQTTYEYDRKGNVTSVTDQNGTIKKSYDELDRLTSYIDIYGNTIRYEYDELGNLSKLIYPDGKEVLYQYDQVNRLIEVKDWNSRKTIYTYDANGNLQTISRPDGSSETYTYDKANQLIQSKNVGADGTVISDFDYGFNEVGSIVSETNKANQNLGPVNITNAAMTYGADNRLASYNGEDAEFDLDGNMTQGPLNGKMDSFVFDSSNRLVEAGNASYVYDAENRRVALTQDGKTTRFVIDPRNALTQVLMETDGEGNPISYYVYGLGLISQEDVDGDYHLYHFDSRGSTIALTNDKSEVTDTFAYGPYGELLTRTGSTHTNFLFNGQFGVITDDNGLYYMRARFYNPEIKRFINQDILLGNISDSSTLNRYAYVNGQPINLIDPFGLCGMEGLFGGMSDWIENNQKTIQFVAWGISLYPPAKGVPIVVDIILYGNSYYRYSNGKMSTEEFANRTIDTAFNRLPFGPGKDGSKIVKGIGGRYVNKLEKIYKEKGDAKSFWDYHITKDLDKAIWKAWDYKGGYNKYQSAEEEQNKQMNL